MADDPDKLVTERVTLRPVVLPNDEEFLQELYFSVRDDLQGLFHDDGTQRQLMLMQYAGQKMTYAREFPNASHDIVLLGDRKVGRLIVDRRPDVIHGVDLAMLPAFRSLGVGTEVLRELFRECAD